MHSNKNPSGLRGLLLLNAVLLALLAAVTLGSSARAQNAGRARGEYTMVAGGANGTDADIVYIADVANQELIAMVYNNNTKVLDGVGYRNLASDGSNAGRNKARPAN